MRGFSSRPPPPFAFFLPFGGFQPASRPPRCVAVLCALRSLRSSFSPVSGDDADIPVDAPEFVGQEKTAHCAHDHRLTSPACAASFNLAFKLSTPVETPYAKIVSRASVARSRIK